MKGKGEEARIVPDPAVVAALESPNARGSAIDARTLRERADGRRVECRPEGGEVRWREVVASDAGEGSGMLSALLGRAAAEFGRLAPKPAKELDRTAPDPDGIELAFRDGTHASGAAGLRALLEGWDGRSGTPRCDRCGEPMTRKGRHGKTFSRRLGKVRLSRTCVRCRRCGAGHFPLDRHMGIGESNVTPGAASVMADAGKDDSYAQASRQLRHRAGLRRGASSIPRYAGMASDRARAFERTEVVAGAPRSGRRYPSVDGTGVPIRKAGLEGVAGRHEDGSARTRGAKVISIHTADGRDAGTGAARKDPGSDVRGALIDSAAAGSGCGADTGFGRRLRREAVRNGLFGAGGLVVISDGAEWIGNVTGELFPRRPVTHVLDFFHVTERLSDALKAILPDPDERRRRFGADRDRLKANGVAEVIASLRPHAARNGAVSGCARYMRANVGRMQYGTYLEKGMRIGSGVVEGACRKLVRERCKKTGSRWSTKGANALLALKSRFENNRRADFLHWSAMQKATA